MRRTARALSVAVLAGTALGVFAGPGTADPGVPLPAGSTDPGAAVPSSVPSASEPGVPVPPGSDSGVPLPPDPADPGVPSVVDGSGAPAAEVRPADVAPGDTVTVSVACGPTGGAAPSTLDATSQAFDEGTVALRKVAGGEATTSGPAYRGTARVDAEAADPEEEPWTVDGTCPSASGDEGEPWSATMTVPEEGEGEWEGAGDAATPKPACPSAQGKSCGGAAVEHGVRAGAGGTFTDSMPALIAGGVLIAGACGAAAHRLRLRLRGEDGFH
ncbi:hypothetical protein ACIGO6_27175 [Streptomyces sp. NPDC053750]|uniref:hypothetical protein n=1 Tax=Streptomyces sp. NPDC053750 TaxID=3365714 RepID=UPI0037D4F8C7